MMAPMKIEQERAQYLQKQQQARFEMREKYGYMPPRGYMPPYEDPYYSRPPSFSSRQGPDWGYERRPMWNGAELGHEEHFGRGPYHHGEMHHDIVSETPYHDYNHDVYQHHG